MRCFICKRGPCEHLVDEKMLCLKHAQEAIKAGYEVLCFHGVEQSLCPAL